MAATAKAFGVCALLGAAFGVLGAAAFGPSVSSVVITMLGETVRHLFCVSLPWFLQRRSTGPDQLHCLRLARLHRIVSGRRIISGLPPVLDVSQAAATAVKLLLCVNLMLTFPIVCRSAFLIIEALVEKGGQALGPWQQRALRAAFVVAASVVATR